jgi:hypothetical protein
VISLEDLEPEMDVLCMSILGDRITYRPVSGPTLSLKAYVNYEDVARSLDIGRAIEQAMTVELLRSDAPVRPADGCRITLARLPGKTYKPVNVTLGVSGTHWVFELKAVNA